MPGIYHDLCLEWELVPSSEHVLDENSTHNPTGSHVLQQMVSKAPLSSPFKPFFVWPPTGLCTSGGAEGEQAHSVLFGVTITSNNKVSVNLFWFWQVIKFSRLFLPWEVDFLLGKMSLGTNGSCRETGAAVQPLCIQWLRLREAKAGGTASIPGWGTRFDMQQWTPRAVKQIF